MTGNAPARSPRVPPQPPGKGPALRTSITVLVVGFVLAMPGVILLALAIGNVVFGTTYSVPGTHHVTLGNGTYIVFEKNGNTQNYGPLTIQRNNGVTISADAVEVVGPDGTTLAVRNAAPNQTIQRSSDTYTSAVKFDVPEAGSYAIRFDTTEGGTVMVEHSLGHIFTSRVPWLIGIGVGWFIAVVGVTMLLIGAFRRGRDDRRARERAFFNGVALPGWYDDPHGTHRLRYWTGSEWSEHTAV